MQSAQDEFDARYVTSTELCVDLQVSRVSIFNKRRAGGLPGAIEVRTSGGGLLLLLWEREAIGPHVEEWRRKLAYRRRNIA